MSKNLIKIIAICALVVLCPLVIVGVSLMATEAVGCTLTIKADGIEKTGETDFGGKSSKVTIMINGEAQEDTTIKLTKRDEVTVTFEGVGYDFKGWYEGNYNEINLDIDQAVSNQTSYTFEISKDTVLTAVRDVKTYNVTYAGVYDDQTTPVDLASQTLDYNQPLEMLTPVAGGIQTGWYVEGGQTTTVANFNTTDVTVYPEWAGQMKVEFLKADGTIISTARIFESKVGEFTLPGAKDDIVKNNVTKGYEFTGWTNQVGGEVVTAIVYDTNGIKLVLNESLITYTLNVKYHALSDEVTTVTYDVVNGFSSYNPTREYYTFKGIEYDGFVFTDLSKNGTFAEFLLLYGVKTLDVAAVWECHYQGLAMDFIAIGNYEIDGEEGNWAILDENDDYVEKLSKSITFEDKAEEGYFDLTDNVYEYFIDGFTGLKTMNGDAVEFANKMTIRVTKGAYEVGELISYNVSSYTQLTFEDIMVLVEDPTSGLGSLEGVTKLTVSFVYEVV